MTPAGALLAVVLAAAVAAVTLLAHRLRREQRRAAEAEARAAATTAARDAFFDLATHELRSPLAAILGYQELLQDGAYGDLDESAIEPVVRIGRSARHLLHLIDGVVELSRLRAGGVRPDLEPVNTGVLLAGVADAFRAHARDRGLEPQVHIPPDLPTIRSDPERLLQALDLLVTSSVKHPDGLALHLDVSSSGDDLTLRIHPTELTFREHADDPELRLGIRLAVAGRVATLLGGGLDFETSGEDPVIRAVTFRVRDLGG